MILRYMRFIYSLVQAVHCSFLVGLAQEFGGYLLLIEHYVAPSPVHGLGVFSRHFVPAGTLVWAAHPIIDREISPAEMDSLPPHVVALIQIHSEYLADKKLFRLSADGAAYMNHADDPNLLDRGDEMVARRDIRAGDELFCDYRIAKVMAFDPDNFTVNHSSGGIGL
jgi:uncharacterized protein